MSEYSLFDEPWRKVVSIKKIDDDSFEFLYKCDLKHPECPIVILDLSVSWIELMNRGNKLIIIEELINHPEIWTETEGLNLDFFDFCLKDISKSYFLKKKGADVVYFGHYEPDSQAFVCHQLHAHTETKIKREDIYSFISLPEMNFQPVKDE